jgi:hypothetical protein
MMLCYLADSNPNVRAVFDVGANDRKRQHQPLRALVTHECPRSSHTRRSAVVES